MAEGQNLCPIGEHRTRKHLLLVIHHLRVCSLPADIARSFDLIVSVRGCRDVLGYTALCPDNDVFPVVAMAHVEWQISQNNTTKGKSQRFSSIRPRVQLDAYSFSK